MTDAIDIEAAIAAQTFLEGRTRFSDTTGTFARLAEYRDGAIFAGGFSGGNQWERHPNGDEVVQILKGSVTLTIVAADGVAGGAGAQRRHARGGAARRLAPVQRAGRRDADDHHAAADRTHQR